VTRDAAGDHVVPDGWRPDSVRANGIDVACYRVGDPDGSTVVATHGFYEDARCMRRVVDVLASDGYDVLAYDARGHGRTDAPPSGYAVDDRVADLVGVLDALDLEDPVLYGHSMGGGTVAAAAARHPECASAVVLEDPSSLRGEPDQDPDEMAAFVRERVQDAHAKSHDERVAEVEGASGDPELVARANGCMSEHLAEQARHGPVLVDDHLPEIATPTLVLRRDVGVAERVRDLGIVEGVADCRLVHVPGSDHHVVDTRPDAALSEIRAFLEFVTGSA